MFSVPKWTYTSHSDYISYPFVLPQSDNIHDNKSTEEIFSTDDDDSSGCVCDRSFPSSPQCFDDYCQFYLVFSLVLFLSLSIWGFIGLYKIFKRSEIISRAKITVCFWTSGGTIVGVVRYALILCGYKQDEVLRILYALPLIFLLNSNISILYFWKRSLFDMTPTGMERFKLLGFYIVLFTISFVIYFIDFIFHFHNQLWELYVGICLVIISMVYLWLRRKLNNQMVELGLTSNPQLNQISNMINTIAYINIPFGILLVASAGIHSITDSAIFLITRQIVFNTMESLFFFFAFYLSIPDQTNERTPRNRRDISSGFASNFNYHPPIPESQFAYTLWSDEDDNNTTTNIVTETLNRDSKTLRVLTKMINQVSPTQTRRSSDKLESEYSEF